MKSFCRLPFLAKEKKLNKKTGGCVGMRKKFFLTKEFFSLISIVI
jgi:hypothetical protein